MELFIKYFGLLSVAVLAVLFVYAVFLYFKRLFLQKGPAPSLPMNKQQKRWAWFFVIGGVILIIMNIPVILAEHSGVTQGLFFGLMSLFAGVWTLWADKNQHKNNP